VRKRLLSAVICWSLATAACTSSTAPKGAEAPRSSQTHECNAEELTKADKALATAEGKVSFSTSVKRRARGL
jgi:hypothetical protein